MANGTIENIFLVNAPAGSGKTTKIRGMVEKHLREKPDDNILCITYTNRAADELGRDIISNNIFFGTVHAFINSFIKSFFSHREVIDFYWKIYRERIEERILNPDNKENVEESNQRYIEKYGKLDLETIYCNLKEISYSESQNTSLYRGALSHDDLIFFTRNLVDEFPTIKRKIADKYQLIFIDEYQDTSADVLHIFFETMKESDGQLYLLGDKMQQIYKNYDGSFETEFEMLNHSLNLITNYRTTPKIVSILNYIYNDHRYNQICYEKNSDQDMSYFPEVIFSNSPIDVLNNKINEYPNALILYLLNKDRFSSIGAGNLYKEVQVMEKYQYGRKYSVTDVLTTNDETNPDKLFLLLFIFEKIKVYYKDKLYGKIIREIKKNKAVFNLSKLRIRSHGDKKIVGDLLDNIMDKYCNDSISIKFFLELLGDLDVINEEYLSEILGDKEYGNVLDIELKEFRNLTSYLNNPHISTQHGVKGESHDTVIFMAANSKNPAVNMSLFFQLWSSVNVDLVSFEKFYYDYRKLIQDIEQIIGMKISDMKKKDLENNTEKIINILRDFESRYKENDYYCVLLKEFFNMFFEKSSVLKNLNNCMRENYIYGVLSAYRLFYVGCSRARKNLTVIVDVKDVKEFEDGIKHKFKECGFNVVEA